MRSDEMNPQKLQEILDQSTRTVGTGFVVDADGYILTNEHVIDQSLQCWVTTADHKVWPAVVVGSDPRADLAVLKIPASHLTPVKFAADEEHQRGEWTIALGNPYGLATDGEPSMSVGVIAATDRSLPRLAVKEDRLYSRLIQTTAQINPGNSGGPLFDIEGRVIGVNTAVILPQKQINGIGFAIPVTSRLVAEVRDLEEGREVVYGYLGVTVVEATASDRAAAKAPENVGVRVDQTEAQSPVDPMLQRGDLLVSFNGQTIHDSDQFVRLVGEATVGRPVQLGLLRNGKAMTVTPVPKRRAMGEAAVTRQTQRLHWRGAMIGSIPSNETAGGLLVAGIEDDSPLKKDGVREGSVITAVAGRKMNSLVDLLMVINDVPDDRCVITLAVSGAATQPAK
jgi:serine protease Do